MKKIFGMILGIILLCPVLVFGAISGQIGLDLSEEKTDIFVEVEQKFELDNVNFYFSVKCEKSRSNEITTKDTLDVNSGFEEEFPMFMLGADIALENDALNEYQRTTVVGSVGKDFEIGEADLEIKGSAGYSWVNGIEGEPVLKVSNAFQWGIFYQDAEAISAVDNADSLAIEASAGLRTKISENLALKTGYTIDYTKALDDRYNHSLRSSVSFSF